MITNDISNKCCSFELSTYQRIQKKVSYFLQRYSAAFYGSVYIKWLLFVSSVVHIKRPVNVFSALPITFKRELQDQISTEGESAVFICELSKPGAPVEWRKGRVMLKSGAKYQMTLEGRFTKLLINNLVEGDAGNYTCKTKDSQSTAELLVQGKVQSVIKINKVLLIFLTLWISYAFHFHHHLIFV